MGVWFITPVVIINAYVLVGMWLKHVPKPIHILAWLMAIPAIFICLMQGPVRPAFLLLALSWILSGNGLLPETKARIKPTLSK